MESRKNNELPTASRAPALSIKPVNGDLCDGRSFFDLCSVLQLTIQVIM